MKKEQLLIAKVADKIKLYEKTGCVVTTNFLDPSEKEEIKIMVSKLPNYFFGGFEMAERQILLLGIAEEDPKEFLQVVTIVSENKNVIFSHREVLGSILGLGIKREMIGDILLKENRADVIVIKEISNYILQNLNKIGREKVEVNFSLWDELLELEDKSKEIKTTVASLRVDAIVSSGIGVSREMSSKLIQNQKVKLNHKIIENTSKKINEGDKLSIRGYGRIELVEILGETRKDRIRVILKRY